MDDFPVLIGGKAGSGIDKSAMILGHLLNRYGYRIYIYRDYPSLIRGGHTFSIIRASCNKISTHKDKIDFLLALNKETIELHQGRLTGNSVVIYDSDAIQEFPLSLGIQKLGLPISQIVKKEQAHDIMRNTGMIGAFSKVIGFEMDVLENVLAENFPGEAEQNVKIAELCFAAAVTMKNVSRQTQMPLPLISGSHAIGLGLVKGGLEAYVAYPMTPTTPILHFLAEQANNFSLQVVHPESEISVILMALGFAYVGKKAAVGTSGGGFCLMTESLSLAGMSEIPVVIVLGQRPGPSTGLPTYSGQSDLHFALNAGQGDFVRLVVAPGDLEEAYYWSAQAMNLAWKYQIPSIILTDKNLNEGISNLDMNLTGEVAAEPPPIWDGNSAYRRYEDSEMGVSPLAFAPEKGAVIKVNSYEHDEFGITTENPAIIKKMQDKRLRKEKYLIRDLKKLTTVNSYGNGNGKTALLCWGSNKGVCVELGQKLGLKVVQPIVLSPFPEDAFRKGLKGINKLISIENNATGQLARLIKSSLFNNSDFNREI